MKTTKRPTPASDVIVDEIRAIRADISAQFGNDIGKLCEYLRRKEAEYGDRVVKPAKVPTRTSRHAATEK